MKKKDGFEVVKTLKHPVSGQQIMDAVRVAVAKDNRRQINDYHEMLKRVVDGVEQFVIGRGSMHSYACCMVLGDDKFIARAKTYTVITVRHDESIVPPDGLVYNDSYGGMELELIRNSTIDFSQEVCTLLEA